MLEREVLWQRFGNLYGQDIREFIRATGVGDVCINRIFRYHRKAPVETGDKAGQAIVCTGGVRYSVQPHYPSVKPVLQCLVGTFHAPFRLRAVGMDHEVRPISLLRVSVQSHDSVRRSSLSRLS